MKLKFAIALFVSALCPLLASCSNASRDAYPDLDTFVQRWNVMPLGPEAKALFKDQSIAVITDPWEKCEDQPGHDCYTVSTCHGHIVVRAVKDDSDNYVYTMVEDQASALGFNNYKCESGTARMHSAFFKDANLATKDLPRLFNANGSSSNSHDEMNNGVLYNVNIIKSGNASMKLMTATLGRDTTVDEFIEFAKNNADVFVVRKEAVDSTSNDDQSRSSEKNSTAAASHNTEGNNSNASDLDRIKRDVITKIAQDHNMNPGDVVAYDAQVSPAKEAGSEFHVSGNFVIESDRPSSIYDAVGQQLRANQCAVDPNSCVSKKIKHTVYFDAVATESEKLDGTKTIQVNAQTSVDRPLQPAQPAPTIQSPPPVVQRARPPANTMTSVETRQDAVAVAQDAPPSLISKVEVNYPHEAKRRHHQGTALVLVLVGTNGRPIEVSVATSSGYPELDSSAINAARRLIFKPAIKGGKYVESYVKIPMAFSLNTASSSRANGPVTQPITQQQTKPSFDCAKASTPTEIAICSDGSLSELDAQVATEYRSIMGRAAGEQAQSLLGSQRLWIRERSACGPDVTCLRQSMEARLAALPNISP